MKKILQKAFRLTFKPKMVDSATYRLMRMNKKILIRHDQ